MRLFLILLCAPLCAQTVKIAVDASSNEGPTHEAESDRKHLLDII